MSLNIIRSSHSRLLAILAASLAPSIASAATVWSNPLPTGNLNSAAGSNRSNAAPIYGSLCDPLVPPNNCSGVGPQSPSEPYILGDQFNVGANTNITSVTVYEVGNSPTSGTINTPDQEFRNISLFLGADQTPLTLVSSTYTFQRVQYNGTTDYESLNTNGLFFPIYSITFSGLNFLVGPGLNDFAIGATPIGNNTFALHTSDPTLSGPTEDSASLSPNGFLYFFDDPTPDAAFQYSPGSISNYSNGADANVSILGDVVPEPGTIGLLGLGLAGLRLLQRKRRKA